MDEDKNPKPHPSSILVRRQKFEGMSSAEIKTHLKNRTGKPDSYYQAESHLADFASDYFTIHFVFKGKKKIPYDFIELNSMDANPEQNYDRLLPRKHLGAFSFKDLEKLAEKSVPWVYIENHNYKAN